MVAAAACIAGCALSASRVAEASSEVGLVREEPTVAAVAAAVPARRRKSRREDAWSKAVAPNGIVSVKDDGHRRAKDANLPSLVLEAMLRGRARRNYPIQCFTEDSAITGLVLPCPATASNMT